MQEKKTRGRPKGSPNKGIELGRKTIFSTTTISGSPEEITKLKQLAKENNKSISRFVLDMIKG